MKHNLKEYSDEALIELCRNYKYSKDIPRWLYSAVHHRGIQDKAQAHLINLHPQRNLEEVRIEAEKYESRGEFQKQCNWAYQWARKHHVLDEVCSHMKAKGNLKSRCIYVATFEDGYAYVGLTWETKDRWFRHMHPSKSKPSPIYIHKVRTGLTPNFEQLTDYIPAEEAQEAEKEYIKEYSKSWRLLNTSDGGELGSNQRKWTKKNVLYIVGTCNSYKEFCEDYPGAYSAAQKNNWSAEIQDILPREREIWSESRIREVLSLCNSYQEASSKYGGAINAARQLGIWDEVSKHFNIKQSNTYTKAEIEDYVKGLTFKYEFLQNRSMVYAATKLGIYADVTKHLLVKPHGKTLEEYKKLCSSYKFRGEFKKEHPGAYAIIISKEGWAEECFQHMEYQCRVNLSDEDILKGASMYKTINEWQENDGGAYNAAKKRGIFEEATKHMQRPPAYNKKPDEYYLEVSSNYKDLALFRKECPNEYAAITRRGDAFLELCTRHMNRRKHTYTKEEAFAIAKHYTTKMQLNKANPSVYNYLRTRGWLNECFPLNSNRWKKL